MANSSTSAAPAVLTDRQVAETVLNTLQAIQLDRLNNKMAILRDGSDGSRPSGVTDGSGNVLSWNDREKQLAQSEAALVEEYKDLLPDVAAIVEERKAAAQAS